MHWHLFRAAMACLSLVVTPTAMGSNEQSPTIAYLANSGEYWQVWVMDERGHGQRQVTQSPSDKTRVCWFPDGRRLLVSAQDGKVYEVVVATGAESVIRLEQAPVLDAVISPDGKTVAYSFSSANDGNDIWLANVDGSGTRKIAKQASLQHEPSWAPDGSTLYFLSGDGGQAHDIWRVRLSDLASEQLTVGQLYHFDVAVSANGTLAYSSNRDGNYELYLQPVSGPVQRLTNDPALDARPAFAPDDERIAFESSRSGTTQIWIINLKGGQVTQLTEHQNGARAPAWLRERAP